MSDNNRIVSFPGMPGQMAADAVAPLGFSAALRQVQGRGAVLIAQGERDASVTVHFGREHLMMSDGCLVVRFDVTEKEKLRPDTEPKDLGSEFAHVMVADGMVIVGDERVLFTRDGMTVAAFALGEAPTTIA